MGTSLRLTAIELHTADVHGLAAFYRDVLGIDLGPGDDEQTHFETTWGEWGGKDFFFFAVQPIPATGRETTGAQVGFEVADLQAVHDRAVASGARIVEPPTARPWGMAATYLDPAGNLVQLTQG
ncbi:MAG: VOC family protein [Acidimicrobiales bacterium]|nr:VOC family protein [Acidimicrobiales bacterium]